MCFGSFTIVDLCGLCGRRHPGGESERCAAVRAAAEAEGLEEEVERYLDSAEAAFLTWLARRAGRPAA